jgi:hypothetical protein
MLEDMATVGDESIVSWQPHGKAFRVHLPYAFARTVMPCYFKQTKYKSFQRQLHIYGFHRICKGVDKGAYCHSLFMRSNKSTSVLMSCQKIKGKSTSSTAVQQHASSEISNEEDNLTNSLQAYPVLQASTTTTKEKKDSGSVKRGPATVFTNGGIDRPQPDLEKPLLNSALVFNPTVTSGCPSPSPELISWMEQAQTIFSWDEEQTPPCMIGDQHDCSDSEKGHDVSALLGAVDYQKHDDQGLFEGKRFFYVAESKMPMMEDFSAVIKRGGPKLYMPRSA